MNKSENATKIKKAIEEKLCALGAYVDKELPEYILVMIANKKSKESMTKDLQLFLGQETTHFIDWLHDILEHCQKNPDDAFNLKSDKHTKSKPISSPEKKKKVDKEKQKVKSKSKKSDEKKDHKKSGLNKSSRIKSRSRSPVLEVASRNNETKFSKSKIIMDKTDDKSNTKHSEPKRIEDMFINDKPETIKPKMISSVASTVKVSERPIPKNDIFKSSFEMVQRDLKEAEADITKPDSSAEKQTHRTSVFDRLGTNDLRAKLNRSQNENQEIKTTGLKRTIQPVTSNDSRGSKVKILANDSSSPCFIVTLKGADKLHKPLKSRLGPKKNQEIVESIEDEIEADVMELNEDESDIFQDSKENNNSVIENQSTRCRFWPSCKNKETCQYLHPSEPCKTFPNCKFGANCIYIHPNCKYSSSCVKPDCPFIHYGPRLISSAKIAAQTLPRCIYYPQCTNVNCKFFHPTTPCRFGHSCMQKESCLYYHPTLPKLTDLKWTAAQETSNSAILAASSKSPEIQTA